MASKKWQNLDGPDISLESLVQANTYIDKTLGIKYLFEKVTNQEQRCLIITVPHGFGLKTNLNLLKLFLEIPVDLDGIPLYRFSTKNYDFFNCNELKIVDEVTFFEDNFAQYPVLHIDLNLFFITSCEEVKVSVRRLIYDLMKKYGYLPKIRPYLDPQERNLDDIDVVHLEVLLKEIFQYFKKKSFVFIQMLESPLISALLYDSKPYKCCQSIKAAISPLRNLLECLVNGKYVEKLIIFRHTAGEIWHFAGSHYLRMINCINLFECRDLSKYYGFTSRDIALIARKLKKEINLDLLKDDLSGHLVEGARDRIFSMNSVLKCLAPAPQRPDIPINSGDCEDFLPRSVKEQFKFYNLGQQIESAFTYQISSLYRDYFNFDDLILLADQIKAQSFSGEDGHIILQYLTEYGYFTPNFELYMEREEHMKVGSPGRFVALSVPNLEKRLGLEKLLYENEYYQDKYRISQEQIKMYVEAVEGLNVSDISFYKLYKSVVELFGRVKPSMNDEMIGPVFNFCRFSEVFDECFGWRHNNAIRFIKRKDSKMIVMECVYAGESAWRREKEMKMLISDVLDMTSVENVILLRLELLEISGLTVSYLCESFDFLQMRRIDSKTKLLDLN